MYGKLADFIIRHYKVVIVAWIILLFYAFPLIFKINEVVVYNEGDVGLNKMEALEAQALIDEQFPGRLANSTVTVVIQNSDVTSAAARDFSAKLYSDIRTSPEMQGVVSVDYVYSAIAAYTASVVGGTAPMMHELYSQTNQTALMVYGIPVEIFYKHLGLVGYGYTNQDAQQAVMTDIASELAASGMNESMQLLAIGYANTFYSTWSTGYNYSSDQALLQPMILSVADPYFTTTVHGDRGLFVASVLQGFNISDFNSQDAQRNFTFDIIASQITADEMFVASMWELGPAPSLNAIMTFALQETMSHTVGTMPLYVPDILTSQFINTHPVSGSANTTMLMAVSLSVGGSSAEAERDVREMRRLVEQDAALLPGYAVFVTGDPAINVDTMDAVANDTSKIDPVTIVLVILIVGLFFRSMVSPWVPLMTIGMAYLLTTAVVFLLGSYVMNIHYSVMTFVLVVMLGAGTDYCIFIMSRYREERVLGKPKEEAVKTSLMWAGESITTSGLTVMIGFGALMISQYSMVKSMGMALVVAVGISLLFALTMLPSLIMLIGDKVFWPNSIDKATKRAERLNQRGGGYFRKSSRFALKHSKAIVVAALLISVPAVYLFFTLESSYDFLASIPNSESKRGLDALGEGFGQGTLMPTYILVQFNYTIAADGQLVNASAAAQLEQYCQQIAGQPNIRSVSGPTRPFGVFVNASTIAALPAIEQATYSMAISGRIGEDDKTVLITVVLVDEPFSSTSIGTIDSVRSIDKTDETTVFGGRAHILVGGATASMTDVSRTVSDDFTTMRIVVLIGIYVVLMVVLGSLLIPLRLILTVLLNVCWTVAMTMIIFQFGAGAPVLWMMPLILFVVAIGLGMDYDIFLTTRIREEVLKGKTDSEAIMTAVERTGGIITACGLVMAGAFGSMMLSNTVLLREFGFGLAFAILLDAMILRIYLVPAVMLLLEKWNWYAPGRLQRVRRAEKARKH